MSKSAKVKAKSRKSSNKTRYAWPASRLLHLIFGLFVLSWFGVFCTDLWVASVDLPGHITVIERLVENLSLFSVRFFDPYWFSGWPAFQFYAPLSHIFAALFSVPLSLVSSEPVRLSAHLILLGSLISIAPLMHYFSKALLESFTEKSLNLDRIELPLAFVSCALSFWFLNHDRQWFGIGAAAALNVGLFSQAVAWPILLYYLTQLTKLSSAEGKKNMLRVRSRVILSFATLFLTHSLSAAFGLFVAIVFFFLYEKKRRELVLSHLNAFLLCGFWLLPFIAYSSNYTGLDIFRPKGDFLEIYFRYPLIGLYKSLKSGVLRGDISLEFTNILVIVLVAVAFIWNALHQSKVFCVYGITVLLGLVVFSSTYVASSIPIGLHYYRFYAYLFLLLTTLLVPIPALYFARSSKKGWVLGSIAALSLLSVFSNILFPHYEREKISALVGEEQFSNERQILAYLKREPNVGRVYFSYFSDYERYPFLSAHFMTSQLWKRNKQETVNGLFIQSALAYRMPVASAALIGIPGYHIPLLFTDNAELSPQVAFSQLLDVGITHVVMGRKDLREAFLRRAVGRVHFIGPYAIIRISKEVKPILTRVSKPVISYLNIDGNVPFHLFEMYFYSKQALYTQFELLQIERDAPIPTQTAALVVSGMHGDGAIRAWSPVNGELPPTIRINHQPDYTLDHYSVWYQHNVELDYYQAIEKLLDDDVNLVSRLLSVPRSRNPVSDTEVSWKMSGKNQKMELEGLTLGALYRINYSYFPYWSSEGAEIYRGMPERIFITAKVPKLSISYSLFSRYSTWFGYLCSIIGLAWLWILRKKYRK